MELLEDFFDLVDYIIKTKRRKHIMSGTFMSIGILFICLSITILTTKEENENE